MKKYFKIVIGILLGFVLLWCVLVWRGVFMSPGEFKKAEAKVTARDRQTLNSPPSGPAAASTDIPGRIMVDDQGVPKPEGMSTADWMRYLRIHATMIKSNHPAAIYMKFIDQHNQPVEGLKVNFRIVGGEDSLAKVLAGSPLQRVEKVPMVSDEAGMIIIEGKRATSFGVDFPPQPEFKLGRGHGPFRFGSLLEAANSPEIFRPDKSKPLIYRIWRRGPPKPTYYFPALFGEPTIKTQEHLQTRVSLVKQAPRSAPLPAASLDLEWKGSPYIKDPAPDWTLTLTAVEGGIVKAPDSDEHGCLAPEAGYVKSLTRRSKDPKVPEGSWYYFRSNDGKIHSSFRLSLRSLSGRPPQVGLAEITTGVTGSREVEHTPGVVNYQPYRK